jgi:hypothetical protein
MSVVLVVLMSIAGIIYFASINEPVFVLVSLVCFAVSFSAGMVIEELYDSAYPTK